MGFDGIFPRHCCSVDSSKLFVAQPRTRGHLELQEEWCTEEEVCLLALGTHRTVFGEHPLTSSLRLVLKCCNKLSFVPPSGAFVASSIEYEMTNNLKDLGRLHWTDVWASMSKLSFADFSMTRRRNRLENPMVSRTISTEQDRAN